MSWLGNEEESQEFKSGEYLTSKAKKVLVYTAVTLLILVPISDGHPWQIFGWQKQPGAFFEKGFYSQKLYVYVSENTKSSKNYRIPAEVERTSQCKIENSEDCSNHHVYQVDNLFWPNGGSVQFEPEECIVNLDSQASCYASDENRTYYVQLTKQIAH